MTGPVVYTALFGGYERLRPQPVAARSGAKFYCFTDEPDLVSDDWTIVPVRPIFQHDPVRSARALKTVGHPLLEEASETLWIDNRVELMADPAAILADWLQECDATFVEHSFRDTLFDEFTAVADRGLDDTTRVWEYLLHTSESHPRLLEARPLWTGIIARRRTPLVAQFGHRWQSLVDRYSRRDQLSVLQAITESGLPVRKLKLDNRASAWHSWPEVDSALGRRPAYHQRWENALRPPAATAAALRDRNLRLERRVQEIEDERDQSIAAASEMTARLGGTKAELSAMTERLGVLQAELTEMSAQLRAARAAAARSRSHVAELEADIGARRRANDRLRDELRTTRRDLDGITASGSYRLARRITALRGLKRE